MKGKIMKTNRMQTMLAVFVSVGLAWSVATVSAQDSSTTKTVPPAANDTAAPPLAFGVSEVLRLQQAAVGDSTIIAYIKNSGNSYALNADQIIYLRQKGVSDTVVSTMLNQPRAGVAAASSTVTAQPAAATAYSGQVSTATVAPAVTYVQTTPAPAYYYAQPYYQPYYYYDYGWYPPVSFSFGWRGGGWHGGHGGWRR
jgi:hypothetical protein